MQLSLPIGMLMQRANLIRSQLRPARSLQDTEWEYHRDKDITGKSREHHTNKYYRAFNVTRLAKGT